jgi:hypothetical protein
MRFLAQLAAADHFLLVLVHAAQSFASFLHRHAVAALDASALGLAALLHRVILLVDNISLLYDLPEELFVASRCGCSTPGSILFKIKVS